MWHRYVDFNPNRGVWMVASVADKKVTNIWKKILLRLKLQARNSLFWSLICKLKVNCVCQLIFWYFDNLGKTPCFSVLNSWHVNTLNSIWTGGQNGCIINWKNVNILLSLSVFHSWDAHVQYYLNMVSK